MGGPSGGWWTTRRRGFPPVHEPSTRTRSGRIFAAPLPFDMQSRHPPVCYVNAHEPTSAIRILARRLRNADVPRHFYFSRPKKKRNKSPRWDLRDCLATTARNSREAQSYLKKCCFKKSKWEVDEAVIDVP